MFRETKRRLTRVNALLVIVILIGLGTTLYVVLEKAIYHRIDDDLMAKGRMLMRDVYRPMKPEFGRELILFYTMNGDVRSAPRLEIDPSFLQEIKPTNKTPSLQTTSFREGSYRVFTFEHRVDDTTYVQIVRNIDSEIELLRLLQQTLLWGGGVSILVAIVLGHVLANYALGPIVRSWKQQEDFVADASHELRTPLAIFQNTAEALLLTPTHTIQEESVQVVRLLKESKRMTRLVDDLLLLAKADASYEVTNLTEVNLDIIVEELDTYYCDVCLIESKKWVCTAEKEIMIRCDENQLRRMLINLIDNAIKFTPEEGSICLHIYQKGKNVHFLVTDTGIGIREDQIPNVFKRFYTVDEARNNQNSHGLGLSIVQWIVNAHAGEISVAPNIPSGTVFHIILPSYPKKG
ncbi:MAG: sensor histidine kinase [Bacilli bacterium]